MIRSDVSRAADAPERILPRRGQRVIASSFIGAVSAPAGFWGRECGLVFTPKPNKRAGRILGAMLLYTTCVVLTICHECSLGNIVFIAFAYYTNFALLYISYRLCSRIYRFIYSTYWDLLARDFDYQCRSSHCK
jgi:hypothetical protein